MKFFPFVFLVVLTLISSCAKAPGKTDAKFKLKIASLTDLGSAGTGGAMLWGKSDKGDMFGIDITSSTDLTLELVNGTWSFWSVAWEGKGNVYNFQGLTRCAKSTAVFSGKEAQVNINLSNATCADSDFSPAVSTSAGVYEFPVIARRECNKLSDFDGFSCGLAFGSTPKSTSRRLLMPAFKKVAGGSVELTGGALVSACHTDNSSEMVDTRLPIGNGVMPAFTILESFFTSTACDETDPKGFVKDHYEMGLRSSANSNTMTYVNQGVCNGSNFTQAACTSYGGTYSSGVCTGLIASVMADVPESYCTGNGGSYTNGSSKRLRLVTAIPEAVYCSGKRIDPNVTTPTVFAGGTGLGTSPYRICKEYQLNSIGAGFANKFFVLNADLDMNATSVFGDQPMAACLSSKTGANFIPIGGMYDSSCNEIDAVSFGSGSFSGLGHTISNIRLRSQSNNIGFIRLDGSVSNLVLKNVEMEGYTTVGAFSGSTSGVLSNLMLLKSNIKGRFIVGGIAGSFTPATAILTNVHAKKSFISTGKNGYSGGLIGSNLGASSLTIEQSSFEGMITTEGNESLAGGLIGATTMPLVINLSYTSGSLIVHGSDTAGGLVGGASGGLTVYNSYSRMNIGPTTFDIGEGGHLGGLVGAWAATANLHNSFYHGSIMHPCFEKMAPCAYGPISGGDAPAIDNTYGTLIYKEWFKGASIASNLNLNAFETEGIRTNLLVSSSPSLFKNVGASFLRLAWESGTCAESSNNLSVATQSMTRGSLANPIVLCNKEQWAQIKNYPSLNYIVGDNLGIGQITTANFIPSFSGSLNGDGYVVGGIYNISNVGTSGIIGDNYGKISNTLFSASYFNVGSPTYPASGLVVNNKESGDIFDNQFLSFNIESSLANYTGSVAGVNAGKIYRNKISSLSSFSLSGGLVAGMNATSGVIYANRVNGSINLLPEVDNINVGLVTGVNAGKILETDVKGTLTNSATGNSGSGSNIAAIVGENTGIIQDVLVKPEAKIVVGLYGPLYGQAIGNVLEGASVKNVVALNEIPVSASMSAANVQSFIGYFDSAATLKNSYFLAGHVFKYGPTAVALSSCTQTGNIFAYDLSTPLVLTSPYLDGFYLPNPVGPYIGSRITASLGNGQTWITSDLGAGNFVLPCSASGVTGGTTNVYPFQNSPDFVDVEARSVSLYNLKSFSYFCPSSTGATTSAKASYICGSNGGELNIVENAGPTGFGYQRLFNAHKAYIQTGQFPETRPTWVMSDEGYPKLFIDK